MHLVVGRDNHPGDVESLLGFVVPRSRGMKVRKRIGFTCHVGEVREETQREKEFYTVNCMLILDMLGLNEPIPQCVQETHLGSL